MTYAVAGVVSATLFFLSVLAHELGHALLAQHKGIEVEGITLWLFGGVAKLRNEAPDASAALVIAAIGPVVSLLAPVCSPWSAPGWRQPAPRI